MSGGAARIELTRTETRLVAQLIRHCVPTVTDDRTRDALVALGVHLDAALAVLEAERAGMTAQERGAAESNDFYRRRRQRDPEALRASVREKQRAHRERRKVAS